MSSRRIGSTPFLELLPDSIAGDPAIRALAESRREPLIELGDLGELDEMKAIGLFAHSGVANHPGDRGMLEIAHRICAVLLPMIQ